MLTGLAFCTNSNELYTLQHHSAGSALHYTQEYKQKFALNDLFQTYVIF